MLDTGGTTAEGLTRREVLKRGAVFGGALLWATPVVQSIGMSAAFAADTSDDCVTYCLKWNVDPQQAIDTVNCDGVEYTVWTTGIATSDETPGWQNLGNDNPGNCLACPEGASNNAFPTNIDEFKIYGDPNSTLWVSFPSPPCSPAPALQPSTNVTGAAKCGSNFDPLHCREVVVAANTVESDPCYPGNTRVKFEKCLNGRSISHIELYVKCCPS